MPDPEVQNAPPVEVPPAPPEVPPAPVVEPTDERGVPYKNVVAEYKRKLDEATQANQQYQQVLGAYLQQQPSSQQQPKQTPQPEADADENQLDPTSRKLVYQIARKVAGEIAKDVAQQTGYRFVQQAEHQQTISSDPELYEEAKRQYASFKQHPLWTNVDDTLVQDRAIAQARAVVGEKRRTTPAPTTPQNRPPGVPPTQPTSTPMGPTNDKDKWIAAYVAQPETLEMFKMFEGHKYNPANESDKKAMLATAEEAYQGTKFTGATARAFQAMKAGAGDDVLVQEI